MALPFHIVQTIDGAHTRHIGYAATFREACQVAIDWHSANDWPSTEIYGPGTHSTGNAYYWRRLAEFIDQHLPHYMELYI